MKYIAVVKFVWCDDDDHGEEYTLETSYDLTATSIVEALTETSSLVQSEHVDMFDDVFKVTIKEVN